MIHFFIQLLKSGIIINSRIKFFQDGCIILCLVVEHVFVVDTNVLEGTFTLVLTLAEGEFIVFNVVNDYFSDSVNSHPPPLVGP